MTDFETQTAPLHGALHGYAMKLSKQDTHDANDLVQDAMVRALKRWDSFDGGNIKSWMFTIVRNTFINSYHCQLRKKSWNDVIAAEAVSLGPAIAIAYSSSSPPGAAEMESCSEVRRTKTAVHRALDAMPTRFSRAVELADLEGMSYIEIAEAMNCPIGTVMSRLYRGRRMLHKLLYEHAREIGLVKEAG